MSHNPLAPRRYEAEPQAIFNYPKYWAECFARRHSSPCPEMMDNLGQRGIIIVTADAYVDHPSFGMAVVGRLLEAQGFQVGIIAQPEWDTAEPFKQLGKPNLFSASPAATWIH